MALTPLGSVPIPPFQASLFDHGDVHLASGRIFVAHTRAGTIEVVDAEGRTHEATIPGCPEASGILVAQDEGLVFAAARGSGRILVVHAATLDVVREMPSGPRPNGLAWDDRRRQLLVADVEELDARLLGPSSGAEITRTALPGRPRWCVHDRPRDRFLVNVREPACVAVIGADPFGVRECWPVDVAGPHGLDLDPASGQAFVACDGGAVVALDLSSGRQVGRAEIAGVPDVTWYNARRRLLYVAVGDPGVVDVIDTATMAPCQRLVTEPGAHTTAFDATRQRLAVFLPGTCSAALYQET